MGMVVTEMYYIIPIQVHLTEITSPHPGESCKSIVLIHYDILLPFKFPKFIVFPIFNFMIVDQNTSSSLVLTSTQQWPRARLSSNNLLLRPRVFIGSILMVDPKPTLSRLTVTWIFFFETFAFITKHNSIKHFLQCKTHYATLLIIQVFTESKQ